MPVDKDEILDEIRRCAAENGGVPLGRERFAAETGIRETAWRGRYWVNWSEAVGEAGLEPNSMQGRTVDDDSILAKLALITRRLGRFPPVAYLRLERRTDSSLPHPITITNRLGGKSDQVKRLRAFCESSAEFADVYAILARADDQVAQTTTVNTSATPNGVVYLIKSGRYHKIGRTNAIGRRSYEIGLQLPEKYALVHSFETDDPAGIERYWHERFKDRRQNGEWFLLSKADVAAFKRRRRFM